MLLEEAAKVLGWPPAESILAPSGEGPSVLVGLAKEKIGAELGRQLGEGQARVGLLFSDSSANGTQAPIAVVCEFSVAVPDGMLKLAHRLAWNFCRAPLLITLEPGLARAWSCCEQPLTDSSAAVARGHKKTGPEIVEAKTIFGTSLFDQEALGSALHWISLSTGHFFYSRPRRFERDGRADEQLVRNLKRVRDLLASQQLPLDVVHDLLARLIFVQFLFDRKDSFGQPALSAGRLEQLFEEDVFAQPCQTLEDILQSHSDTYSFFKWLDERFNGDLFPHAELPGDVDPWAEEMEVVTPAHLSIMADFISGRLDLTTQQGFLWRQYSFDTIPLEFISSIYEAFVREDGGNSGKGVVYTPAFLVDFVLDPVLPWDGEEWDLRILDPACGSGIFLVKAFQRLVHRWKRHHGISPKPTDLARLLGRNLYGADTNKHAIRVASFSLYLAMCDEIDPRSLWEEVTFPPLRTKTLAANDFFELNSGLFRQDDRELFDVVVGNPPWGRNTIQASKAAKAWAKESGWPVSYNDIGPLFLPKCMEWLRERGVVILLQPVSILIKQGDNPTKYRKRLLTEWQVQEVTNLAACRFSLFKKAVGPACVVTMLNAPSTDGEIAYICPKPRMSVEDNFRLSIEPQDISYVLPSEGGSVMVWTTLMWGNRRDLNLMRRLARMPTLEKLKGATIHSRWGVIRGNGRKSLSHLDGRPTLYSNDFPIGTVFELNSKDLPVATGLVADSKASTSFTAFESPQVLIKHRWSKTQDRWRAAYVPLGSTGVICNRNYVSVHSHDPQLLSATVAVYNSNLALYYLLLSSHMAVERPVPTIEQLLSVPLPEKESIHIDRLTSRQGVDDEVEAGLGLKRADQILIQDFIEYTLPDYVNGIGSNGRQPTIREGSPDNRIEPDLVEYAEHFLRVLRAGFGKGKRVAATVLSDSRNDPLPFRAVAIHLGLPFDAEVDIENVGHQPLIDQLRALGSPNGGGEKYLSFQNVIRVYDAVEQDGDSGVSVYIVKPDKKRYWTRSAALRDADDVVGDITIRGFRSKGELA